MQLADEANWEPALSAQLGVWARPTPGTRARLAVTGRYGPEDTGKLTGQKEAWIGVLFGFDRTGRCRGSGQKVPTHATPPGVGISATRIGALSSTANWIGPPMQPSVAPTTSVGPVTS